MLKEKKVIVEQPVSWQLPYCSLIILIVSLFVMLCSYASLTTGRLAEIRKSFREALIIPDLRLLFPESRYHRALPPDDARFLQERVAVPIQKFLKGKGFEEYVFLKTTQDYLKITVLDAVLFAPGETNLLPTGQALLRDIGTLLRDVSVPVYIESHTDDATGGWQRTALRAAAVMTYMRDACGIPQQRLSAAGCSAYRPFVPNISLEERRRNRRIELMIPIDEAVFTKRGGITRDPPPSFRLWDLRAQTGGTA